MTLIPTCHIHHGPKKPMACITVTPTCCSCNIMQSHVSPRAVAAAGGLQGSWRAWRQQEVVVAACSQSSPAPERKAACQAWALEVGACLVLQACRAAAALLEMVAACQHLREGLQPGFMLGELEQAALHMGVLSVHGTEVVCSMASTAMHACRCGTPMPRAPFMITTAPRTSCGSSVIHAS